MSLTAYPTLRLKLSMPQSLKLQYLPAIPGTNIAAAAAAAVAAAGQAQAAADAAVSATTNKVDRTGDVMTGFLTLNADPTVALHAATKQYVDSHTSGGGNVSNSGTPAVGQYAQWVTATTIQGVSPAAVLSDIGAQPAGSYLTTAAAAAAYQPLDGDLTSLAAATGTGTTGVYYRKATNSWSTLNIGTGLSLDTGTDTLTATAAGVTDGDKGDITVSSGVWTIDPQAVTYAKIQNVTTARILGRITGGSGVAEELTGTQATTLLDVFTDTLKGLAPLSGGGTTNFLRADGTWATPVSGGAPTGAEYITGSTDATLSNERVLTNTATVVWDFSTPGQAKATATGGGGGSLPPDGTYTDIAVTSSGTVWTIRPAVVTYSKIQNISATSRLLGRITAGAGVTEELTGANVKTIVGSGDLTKTDDTNVTLTLGGTPAAALYNAVSLTLGWAGTLSVARGGLGVGTITGLMQGNGTGAVTGITNSSTVGQVLRVTGASTYAWGALDLANANAVTGLLQAASHPALTGDVTTVSGALATTIATGAVTFAKMQDIATDSLIGRDTASTGDPENITLNATLSMTGAGALQRAALTGDVTAVAGSNTTAFRSGLARSVLGVTGNAAAVLADIQGATDQVLRVNGAGTALAFGAIDLSKTAAATGVLQAASFPALTGDVTTVGGALAATIANDAVTYAKMQNVSAASLLIGRGSAAGAGDPQEITLGTNLSMSGTTLNATGGGGSSAPSPPQGRLTLTTATPVMATSQTAATTIFYSPYVGDQVPIYNGTAFTMTTAAELSNVTTASSTGNAGPAAVAANSIYDLFVWSNGGTMTLTRGPAWSSDTTRGAGTTLVRTLGIWLNNAAITNGPAASRGTYVGTVRSNASSQIDFQFGGSGTPGFFGVWNTYNRVQLASACAQSTASWAYTSATIRATNGNNNTRLSFVSGLAEEATFIYYFIGNAGTAGFFNIGVALNSTTTQDATATAQPYTAQPETYGVSIAYAARLGFYFVAATEQGDGTNAHTSYSGGAQQQLTTVWMV